MIVPDVAIILLIADADSADLPGLGARGVQGGGGVQAPAPRPHGPLHQRLAAGGQVILASNTGLNTDHVT